MAFNQLIRIGLFFFLISARQLMAQPAEKPTTFCNPLNLNYRFMVDAVDAREAADPVIVLYKDDYYLFASRSGGYWTSPDLLNWTFIKPQGLDVESYAPAILAMRDTLFFVPGGVGQVYKTADPKSGIWVKGPSMISYNDPALFLDDDGKLYMSYGVSNVNPISVVELDPFTFKQKGTKVDVIYPMASKHGWERRGDDNFLDEQPWIEGSWMIKHGGKYYLHYSAPGTEFKTYGYGIYVADNPLGPYTYAPYSPFSFKPSGFITGASHGATFMDKDGNYWQINTMTISVKHMFERRLGLEPVDFDEDGIIRCNTVFADYPQFAPGIRNHPIDSNFTGLMALSYKKYVLASTSMAGHETKYAVDEDVRTYWSALTGNPGEWLMVDLGKACVVEALQVNFAEQGTNPDLVRGRDHQLFEQYQIETSNNGMTWNLLVDKSQNTQDVPHDYIELDHAVTARYFKIINLSVPGGGTFAIRDLRIFGNRDQTVFTPAGDVSVERDTTDGRDAIIRWKKVDMANGYLIRYGIAPGKLYNNYMVYDVDSLPIHSLNHGVEYYFDVLAFNNGTEDYKSNGEFKTHQSGNWDDVNTWEQFDGSAWINPVSHIPSPADGPITIQDADTVIVSASDSADQMTISSGGILVIEHGAKFFVKNGIESDLVVEGTIKNYGTILQDTLTSLSFTKDGRYLHEQDGGIVPVASWSFNSTVCFDSIRSEMPRNLNQNFYNLEWNCPEQSANLSLGWNGIMLGGSIIITNTGSGILQMCDPLPGTKATVKIQGFQQSGGTFTTSLSSDAGSSYLVNNTGNFQLTGGTFSPSLGDQGGSGHTTWNLFKNLMMENATVMNNNQDGAILSFVNRDSIQHFQASNIQYGTGGLPVEVDSGVVVDMGTSGLQGEGNFTLNDQATLITAHPDGIDGAIAVNGIRNFSANTNYIFNGSVKQITGADFPVSIQNFTLRNDSGVTITNPFLVNGNMKIEKGFFAPGSSSISYGQEASLEYSGTTSQTTTDAEFPLSSGPATLIINNRVPVKLHNSRDIKTLLMKYRFNLGANGLSLDSVYTTGPAAYAITAEGGSIIYHSVDASTRVYPVGAASYSPVWITNLGTPDQIGVGVIADGPDSLFAGRVKLKYKIEEKTPGDGDYTIRFGWNSTVENSAFKTDRLGNAKIFNMTDTTEAGVGDYITQFSTQPLTVERVGITALGNFVIGKLASINTGIEHLYTATESFRLLQNQPNPFHSLTKINFEVREKTVLNLKIYNLFGETLADEGTREYVPGTYTVTLDASSWPAGIYYCTVRAVNSEQTRKLIKLK